MRIITLAYFLLLSVIIFAQTTKSLHINGLQAPVNVLSIDFA